MTVRGVTLCILLAAVAAACSDPDEPRAATTTEASPSTTPTTASPARAPSTTTTAFDPASIEGEIEAAYLRSWDVYATAVYDLVLDEAALAEVFAEEHLATKLAEIERRIEERRAALVRIDHDYSIDVLDPTTALIIDRYRNHQVLIDPDSKQPIEPDPNEIVVDAFTVRLLDGSWKVSYLEGLQ